MNVNTGHLIETKQLSKEELQELFGGYEPVPEDLEDQAMKELAGKKETMVNLNSSSPLAVWAGNKRKTDKKNKRKMVKQSRKKNRK